MTAFTRFCALCHLDLDFLGTCQILDGYTKPSGSYLFDSAVHLSAQACRTFTTFTRIGLAVQTIHCLCQTFMRFLRYRPIGHRPGFETLYNLFLGLHLFQWHRRRFVKCKLKRTAQRVRFGYIIDHRCVFQKTIVIAALCRLLQRNDGVRIVHMIFFFFSATFPEKAGTVKFRVHAKAQRVKGMVMPPSDIRRNLFQPNAANARYGIGKIPIYHILTDSQTFKDLCGLIGLNCRNSHFGCNFDNAMANSVVIILDRRIIIFVQHLVVNQFRNAFMRQIRINGFGTIAQNGSELMHITHLTALQQNGNSSLLFGAY